MYPETTMGARSFKGIHKLSIIMNSINSSVPDKRQPLSYEGMELMLSMETRLAAENWQDSSE